MTDLIRNDIYARVTDRIVQELEAGVRPWLKPWTAPRDDRMPLLPLRANGMAYRGINVLLLWGAAQDAEFTRNVWMTYKQASERGAQVRKGEHGSLVVFANQFTRTEQDEHGEDIERQISFMKAYTVFNVEQIDGLPSGYYEPPAPRDRGDSGRSATRPPPAPRGSRALPDSAPPARPARSAGTIRSHATSRNRVP